MMLREEEEKTIFPAKGVNENGIFSYLYIIETIIRKGENQQSKNIVYAPHIQ